MIAFQYQKGTNRKDEEGRCIWQCRKRAKVNNSKLKKSRIRIVIRKKIFIARLVRLWNRSPTEVVDASSLEGFKARFSQQPPK